MLLSEVVGVWEEVAAARSRRSKIARLAACLRRLPPEERAAGASFLAGEPAPGRLGVGWALLVAATPSPSSGPPCLTIGEVDAVLRRVAAAAGAGSRGERRAVLAGMLGRATPGEQRFLQSLIMRDLHQGALAGLLAEALAEASGTSAEEVRRALMVHDDLGEVAVAALGRGAAALARFRLTLFRPLQPMLAQTAAALDAPLEEIGRVVIEAKIDGARIQVHRQGERAAVFTRSGREITAALPEVVAAVLRFPAESLILDGEVVALRADGRPHPFQTTMSLFGRREGARDVAARPLTPLFFDCLHRDGVDLITRPAETRWEALAACADSALLVPRAVTAVPAEARAFYDRVLAWGHEGVLVKDPAAPYEAGRRGAAWLKVKPAHTLDLVVLAAEWGSGHRRGFLSNLHLGRATRPRAGSSCWARPSRASRMNCWPGRLPASWPWRPNATGPWSSCTRHWWSRWPATESRPVLATPAASRCASPASRAIAPTRAPPPPTPSTPCEGWRGPERVLFDTRRGSPRAAFRSGSGPGRPMKTACGCCCALGWGPPESRPC